MAGPEPCHSAGKGREIPPGNHFLRLVFERSEPFLTDTLPRQATNSSHNRLLASVSPKDRKRTGKKSRDIQATCLNDSRPFFVFNLLDADESNIEPRPVEEMWKLRQGCVRFRGGLKWSSSGIPGSFK
jgi:hypothetical protein